MISIKEESSYCLIFNKRISRNIYLYDVLIKIEKDNTNLVGRVLYNKSNNRAVANGFQKFDDWNEVVRNLKKAVEELEKLIFIEE